MSHAYHARRPFDPGKRKYFRAGAMPTDVELVVDACCGTGTSAGLYTLLTNPASYVIGIDRDKTAEWVRSHLPSEVQDLFLFLRCDIRAVTLRQIDAAAKAAWSGLSIDNLTHFHWSPPCETLSRATRGLARYRDQYSRPRRKEAMRDDAAFEAGVRLVEAVVKRVPTCLVSIENPKGPHFLHLPGVRRLMEDSRWVLTWGSHCKCAGPLDRLSTSAVRKFNARTKCKDRAA